MPQQCARAPFLPGFVVQIIVASFLIVCASRVHAQNQPPSHPARPTRLGLAKWEPASREISAPYWTLEPGWNTDLEVRNNLDERDLKVTPVLRTAAGREIELAPVTLASEQVVSIDLREAVTQIDPGIANRVGSYGSVAVRFSGLHAKNVFAASMVHREGSPIDFHFDGDYASSDDDSSGVEGLWWLPADTSTDYLILSNPSKELVKGNLQLTTVSGAKRQIPVTVGPGQTERLNIRDLLGPSASGGMGGLSLSFANKEALSATQIVFDESTGLAALMKLFERDDEKVSAHVLRAPMMALSQPDPALTFPQGTVLVPRVFLSNASQSALSVSAAVDWRAENNSGTAVLLSQTLAPGQVKILNLGETQSLGTIPANAMWATIRLGYHGKTADLVAVALSYDKEGRYGLQTPFDEDTNRLFKGTMWHVDATHNTLITTGNGGSEPTAAQVTLFYNDGRSKYRIEKVLAPGKQLWLDVGQLIRNQVPDSDGNTIPADTMTGSYELRDLDHATVGLLYEGKLVIDKTYGHASYGCGLCCGFIKADLTPDPFGGPPGIDNSDILQASEQCGGAWMDVTLQAPATVGKATTRALLRFLPACCIPWLSAVRRVAPRFSYRMDQHIHIATSGTSKGSSRSR